jgi:predicted metal-dependent hydrolase
MIHSHDGIEYSLVRSDRKTLSIYVEPNGSVLVRAPNSASIERINEILEKKRLWVYRSLVEFQELNHTKVTRKISNGEGFLFLGKSYRLKIDPNLIEPFSLNQGYFLLNESRALDAKRLFIDFYKDQGKKFIPKRVTYFREKIGVTPNKIVIRELKNRWASISKTALNFNWKIMMASISIIDYLVVHELAHYIHPDHGSEFWELVESVMPNYLEKKNWLRLNGAFLDV